MTLPPSRKRSPIEYGGVSYLRLEQRLGASGAANRGIGCTDSVFVVRLDADDLIGPRYLRQADALLSAGSDIANPDAVLFGEQSGTWAVPPKVDLQMMLKRNYVHCAAAFRRRLWGQAGGFDEELTQWLDYNFWIRLVAAGARVRALPGEHSSIGATPDRSALAALPGAICGAGSKPSTRRCSPAFAREPAAGSLSRAPPAVCVAGPPRCQSDS